MAPPARLGPPTVPAPVTAILERLWESDHAAYLVGGSLRDALMGREPADWDVTTDARPKRIQALFPGSHYENRFGTVLVPTPPAGAVEVTTFRRESDYGDHRRPDRVTFGDSLVEDLARRDFTVNAIAWGRSTTEPEPGLADPTDGLADLEARRLRAVGDPARRFDEDALRLLRAVRLAAQLDFAIEPATMAALRAAAPLLRHVSRERVGREVRLMLRVAPPSRGFRLLETAGLLAVGFPLLEAQRGIPQDKVRGEDLWSHSLRTLDAAARRAAADETLLLAALLHDCGKPETLADGHFLGHDEIGAERARELLAGLALSRREVEPIVALVRHHMFGYTSDWSDAAVRRFIRRVGPELLPRLLLLRAADNEGSGLPVGAGGLDELERRIAAELARGVPLTVADLAVDGHDLQRELGITPGPRLGAMLRRLLESVVADPRRNDRQVLLTDARAWLVEGGQPHEGGPDE